MNDRRLSIILVVLMVAGPSVSRARALEIWDFKPGDHAPGMSTVIGPSTPEVFATLGPRGPVVVTITNESNVAPGLTTSAFNDPVTGEFTIEMTGGRTGDRASVSIESPGSAPIPIFASESVTTRVQIGDLGDVDISGSTQLFDEFATGLLFPPTGGWPVDDLNPDGTWAPPTLQITAEGFFSVVALTFFLEANSDVALTIQSITVEIVPEPTSAYMLILGVLGLARWRKKPVRSKTVREVAL